MKSECLTLELLIDQDGHDVLQTYETINWQLVKQVVRCSSYKECDLGHCRGYNEYCEGYKGGRSEEA